MSECQAPDNFILRLMRGEAPPHPIGETLGARILERVVRRGREIVNVTGELSQGGRTVATATATCMLVAARPKPSA